MAEYNRHLVIEYGAERPFICDIVELKQRHVEPFAMDILLFGPDVPIVKYAGEITRAAVRAGWFTSQQITENAVRDMDPILIRKLADEIGEIYKAATEYKSLQTTKGKE